MPWGPGRYDAELTRALESIRQKTDGRVFSGVLIVRGEPGYDGFSAQLTLEDTRALPGVLRKLADRIEADVKKGAFSS